MRRAAALLLPITAATLIAGCGSSSSPAPAAASQNASVKVTGAFGKAPTVQIPAKKATSKLSVTTEIKGAGPALPTGDNVLGNFAVYLWSGTTHKLLDSTFASAPQILPAQLPLTGLTTALHGQTLGSRVVAVLPPKYAYGSGGNSAIGVAPTDTLVWVIDLIKAFSPKASASGTHVSGGGGSLPKVSAPAAGVAPKIKVPGNQPPAKLVVKTLIKGSGAPLATGQNVVANYVATIWRTGKVFNTTWPSPTTPASAPFTFTMGQLIPGFNKGLVGVPVGSRVMLVIPPADGYGKKGNPQAKIKGTDTLVFVVDVLDAEPAG